MTGLALRSRPTWAALERHYRDVRDVHCDSSLPRVASATTHCWPMCSPRRGPLPFGKTADEVRAKGTPDGFVPDWVFEGNRPSNTVLLDRLAPAVPGKLVALYEHSVFTQGTMWRIDSSGQWGVELGKRSPNGSSRSLKTELNPPWNAILRPMR